MRIRDIIDLLESQGEWVNRSRTRDRDRKSTRL